MHAHSTHTHTNTPLPAHHSHRKVQRPQLACPLLLMLLNSYMQIQSERGVETGMAAGFAHCSCLTVLELENSLMKKLLTKIPNRQAARSFRKRFPNLISAPFAARLYPPRCSPARFRTLSYTNLHVLNCHVTYAKAVRPQDGGTDVRKFTSFSSYHLRRSGRRKTRHIR